MVTWPKVQYSLYFSSVFGEKNGKISHSSAAKCSTMFTFIRALRENQNSKVGCEKTKTLLIICSEHSCQLFHIKHLTHCCYRKIDECRRFILHSDVLVLRTSEHYNTIRALVIKTGYVRNQLDP